MKEFYIHVSVDPEVVNNKWQIWKHNNQFLWDLFEEATFFPKAFVQFQLFQLAKRTNFCKWKSHHCEPKLPRASCSTDICEHLDRKLAVGSSKIRFFAHWTNFLSHYNFFSNWRNFMHLAWFKSIDRAEHYWGKYLGKKKNYSWKKG